MTAFEEMGVVHELGMAVEEMEWSLPTDIQAEAIPAILGGGDVLMAAETGTGKTGAFCLPILQIVWESVRDIQMGKHSKVMQDQAQQPAIGPKWAMNVFDRDPQLAIDPEGLTCQSREQQAWQGCRANRGVINGGRYYFEAMVTDEGLCRVGWSTAQASHDLGTDKFGYGFGGTGKKSWNKNFDNYGEAYGKSDIIGCLLDLDNGVCSFTKNEKQFGVAWNLDAQLRNEAFYPAVVLKNAEMKFNFGDQPFRFLPAGYVGCAQVQTDHVVVSKATSSPVQAAVAPQKPQPNAPMAIIIEPTRELAEQCLNELRRFKKHLRDPTIRELCLLGGGNSREQSDALRQGVDIVVGTPGRLLDLVSSKDLLLNNIRFFVLDEADGLLSQGHAGIINDFHGQIPQRTADGKRLQMVVCSATLHKFDVKKLADKLMHFPQWIDLKGQDSVPDTVHHVGVSVDPRQDQSWRNLKRRINTDGVHGNISLQGNSQDALSEGVKILKGEYVLAAIRKFNMDQCLIFCRTKLDCDNLEQYMKNVDSTMTCVCLHGDRKPQERQSNLEAFKKGRVHFLICTDVAARGLDIRGMPYVINVTLPDEVPNYIHRIGRVGRAERMGLAISLVAAVQEKVWYHTCPSRGQSCHNTNLRDDGGCCIWYNETGLMGEIEEHLGVTIPQVGKGMDVPVDEFEGKVTYGQKRKATGTGYQDHVNLLQATVAELADLEKRAQSSFLNMRYLGQQGFAQANGSK